MGIVMLSRLSLAALAAAAATPWPASAQCRLCDQPAAARADNDSPRRRPARDRNQPQLRSAGPVRRGHGRGDDSARRLERRARTQSRDRSARDGRDGHRPWPGRAASASTCRAGSTSIRWAAAASRFDDVVSDLPAIAAPRFGRQPELPIRRARARSPATPTAIIAATCRSPLNICEPTLRHPSDQP